MYGDLDVSMIDEMPVGRKAVRTVLRETKDRSKIFTFARNELQKGRQMFFIYPLIEKSEKTELKAAVAEHRKLRDHDFKDFRVGLIHGSMSTEEKDNVMLDFADGRIDVLVATTVVEVGVDIPNATIMVIENPERFGLAQLHQLRGRIGRGSDQAYCILLHDPKMDQQLLLLSQDRFAAKQHISSLQRRLSTMVETSDGFRIAEEDLKIRGGGEFFGLRQSGLPGFSIADLSTDYELLQKARNDAFQVVHQDAQLSRPEHMGIKTRYHQHYRHLFSLGWVG
jgi:ATP-dependent DNA helicase RecG